jgi:hypothetical protein
MFCVTQLQRYENKICTVELNRNAKKQQQHYRNYKTPIYSVYIYIHYIYIYTYILCLGPSEIFEQTKNYSVQFYQLHYIRTYALTILYQLNYSTVDGIELDPFNELTAVVRWGRAPSWSRAYLQQRK